MIVVSVLVGCNQSQPYLTDSRLDKGLVVFLTGIEGRTPVNQHLCKTIAESGVDYAIKLEDWTSRWGPLPSLQNQPRNREVAGDIASWIRSYQIDYPDRPVVVIGQSGGGAVATWVVELLTKDDPVDGLILLVPALSPQYDLTSALDRSRKGIVNTHSKLDFVILGLGTKVFGSMDRKYTESAGMVGFGLPSAEPDDVMAYSRLFQIAWDKRMIHTGYLGGHLTNSAPKFIKQFIVPLVLAPDWDQQFIDTLVGPKLLAPEKTKAPEKAPEAEVPQSVPQRLVIPPDAIIDPV